MAEPVALSTSAEQKSNHSKISWHRHRRRLRRLAPGEVPSKFQSKFHKICRCLKWAQVAVIVVGIIVIQQNTTIRNELHRLSLQQYHSYVYGRSNYCHEPFVSTNITQALHHRLIGQHSVIDAIDTLLRQHENYTAIALIGSQGVGKTLTLNVIETEFQWHSNVWRYIWSNIQSQQHQLKRLTSLLQQFNACGQNALFVDNVLERDLNIITEFHQILTAFVAEHQLKFFVFYVIGTNATDDHNEHSIRIDNVTSIHYRRFDADDIKQCIAIECKRLDVQLSATEIDDIVQSTDVQQTGCKKISAKISRHTKSIDGMI